MAKEIIEKYLEHLRHLTVHPYSIINIVPLSERSSVTKQVEVSHYIIAESIFGLDLNNISDADSSKIDQIGENSARIMHLSTRHEYHRYPHDPKWEGEEKYKSIQEPITCEYIADMLKDIGIKETDPTVKAFHNCSDKDGNFSWWNRFASPEEVQNFNKDMFARIKEE